MKTQQAVVSIAAMVMVVALYEIAAPKEPVAMRVQAPPQSPVAAPSAPTVPDPIAPTREPLVTASCDGEHVHLVAVKVVLHWYGDDITWQAATGRYLVRSGASDSPLTPTRDVAVGDQTCVSIRDYREMVR